MRMTVGQFKKRFRRRRKKKNRISYAEVPLAISSFRCSNCGKVQHFEQPVKCQCMQRHKLKSRKVECGGFLFDSTGEARHYSRLLFLQARQQLDKLEVQPVFECEVGGKLVCRYYADFRFVDRDGKEHVQDYKGKETDVFKIKKKLVEALFPVVIELVS